MVSFFNWLKIEKTRCYQVFTSTSDNRVLFGAKRILVLGEFGGLGLPLEGHTWQDTKNWGYQTFKTKEELQKRKQAWTRSWK